MGAGEEAKDVGQLAPGIGADLKVGQTVRIRTSSGSAYEGVVLAIDDALELAVKKSAVLEIGDNHAEKAKNLRISFAEIVSLEVGDPGMKPGEALFANIMLIGAVAVATFVALVLIYGGPGAN
jgi:small nuclear ribonucleoprotein (snRNP)-like protein